MAKTYRQYCALAHALDTVGDRWTLLIVRELLAGPRRYTDLAAGLVTVPTNLLSARLREMESNGLVQRTRLPQPAAAVMVYELTELGEGLAAPLVELARWGMRTLVPPRDGRSFRAHWLVLALNARFEPSAATGLTESYEFHIEGDGTVRFDIANGQGSAHLGPATDPAVSITADADIFLELAAGTISPADALARGALIDGAPSAIARMAAVLPPRSSGPP
ncbi:MAG TPA: winged helix-turn-helix transcriptional regulator [Streptosporangiaceae bacterium]|nr:winged helix-turn-helix transcriptional regulator [Streptosporangiaceae bacterium]